MNVKYQIFLSSTYEDLKDERDQVVKAILEIGHIPVGMEMFSAADEEQWQIITKHIEISDYYVVVLAQRYGSTDADGLSFTEKEYNCLVWNSRSWFCISGNSSVAPGSTGEGEKKTDIPEPIQGQSKNQVR